MNGPILPGEDLTTVRNIPARTNTKEPPIMINTATTEMHWVCVGYDTRQSRNDFLSYWCDTAEQAEKRCKELHPNFEVYFVRRGDLN